MKSWQSVNLGSVVQLINGDRGKNYPSQKDFINDGIPFINAGHIKEGSIEFESMNYISQEKFNILGSGKVQSDDILYCLRGSLGKTAIIQDIDRGAIASSLVIIRPSKNITTKYLFYFLTSNLGQAEIYKYDNGSTQPNLSAASVKAYQIPLPPLEDQKRIAAILDKADRVRRKRQEAIRLTEELGRSIFLDMFGDPVTNSKGLETKPLGDIVTFLGGGTPARSNDKYFQGEICWASSKDMGNEILVDTQEHITQEAIDNSSTKLVPSGTLLVVVKSKILMKRLPVSRTAIDTCFNQDIKAIVPKNLSLTRYLQAHLKLGQETLLRQARGVNTEGLTLEHLRKYPVLMPKQENIIKYTVISKESEKMLVRNRESFQESENLFNSLLQRAFLGEL